MKVFTCLSVLIVPVLVVITCDVPAVSVALCFMSTVCAVGALVLIGTPQPTATTYRQTVARAHAVKIHHI